MAAGPVPDEVAVPDWTCAAIARLAHITKADTTKRSFFTRLSCYFSLLQYTAILTAYGDGFTELRFAPATRLRRQGQTFRDYVAA
jgi:hypothetical protein